VYVLFSAYNLGIQLIIIIVQVLIVQFLFAAFELQPLNVVEWAFCFCVAASDLVYIGLVRVAIQVSRSMKLKKKMKRIDSEVAGEMKKKRKMTEIA
jgi:uncharacterized membrane protein